MTCAKLETSWIPYLDGKLALPERAQVRAHLAECPACAARLEEFRAVSQALGSWEAPPPSPWFDARLRQRIAAEPPAHAWVRWLPPLSPSFPVSLAALLLLAALLIWTGGTRQALPAQTLVTDVKMDELLHVMDEVDLIRDFEVLGELPKPAPVESGEKGRR